jgi:glyoxylase-like metal-dependent hydrolase (beta-lactamase superfamily II)
MLSDAAQNLSAGFGMPLTVTTRADGDLAPGDTITLDGLDFTVLDTAGHSPAGRSLYCAQAGVVISGDALFAGSIGRTDFHHCDEQMLHRTIRENLLTLPDDTQVLSGHGPPTTIGRERAFNPFLRPPGG